MPLAFHEMESSSFPSSARWCAAALGSPSPSADGAGSSPPLISSPSIAPDYSRSAIPDSVFVSPSRAAASAAEPGAGGDVRAGTVSADTVQANNVTLPDPLLVHEPQSIDASIHIGSLVVNGAGETPADVEKAVQRVLARQAADQRRDILSSLSD